MIQVKYGEKKKERRKENPQQSIGEPWDTLKWPLCVSLTPQKEGAGCGGGRRQKEYLEKHCPECPQIR